MKRGLAGALLLLVGLHAGRWMTLRGEAAPALPCVLDKCLRDRGSSVPPSEVPATGGTGGGGSFGGAPGTGFDFYVLALSWSPGFCATGGADRSPEQCAPGRGLGFVVHGLWPQNRHGYLSNCDGDGTRLPSRAAIDAVRDLYPDPGLARHEWRTHGTCTGLSPTAYFAAVRQARAAVKVPPDLASPTSPAVLAPRDIARAFIASTSGLRPDAIAVTCRRGTLAEVRVCLTPDLRGFQSCPEVVQDGCRTRDVAVPPPG